MDLTGHDTVEPAPNDPLGPPLPRFMLDDDRDETKGVARLWKGGGKRGPAGNSSPQTGAPMLPLTPRAIAIILGSLGLAGSFLFATGLFFGLNLQSDTETNRATTPNRQDTPEPSPESTRFTQTSPATHEPQEHTHAFTPPPPETTSPPAQELVASPPPESTTNDPVPTLQQPETPAPEAPPQEPVTPAPETPIPETITPHIPPPEQTQPTSVIPVPAKPVVSRHRAAAPTRSGRYTVQVGAFLSAANAQAMSQRLVSSGFAAGITLLDDHKGRTLYKVQVGHYATSNTAKPTLASLKSLGIDAIIVRAD